MMGLGVFVGLLIGHLSLWTGAVNLTLGPGGSALLPGPDAIAPVKQYGLLFPAVGALVNQAGNASPVIGYTVTYAIANVPPPRMGPVAVSLVHMLGRQTAFARCNPRKFQESRAFWPGSGHGVTVAAPSPSKGQGPWRSRQLSAPHQR